MTHILGTYWCPGHQRPTDIDYMTRLQPPAIRVLDPDVNQMSIAHKAAPNALLLPRDWALSEQHDDVRRDPVGTGKRHAQDWHNKLAVWRATGLKLPPDNQIIVVGINEMQVWNMLPQAVEYTVAMLDESTRLGLRACALNLSVGWPANNGTDTPPDWKPYAPIEASIKRGNHILVLHSYWYKSGPQDGAGWWAWRHRACPWDVPIIIGECSVDLYVDMKRWENDGKPNRGWRGNISPEQYAAQMEEYARGCDRRVVAILPFLTDYRSNNWESFDTAEAHNALLARKDRMVPQVRFGGTAPTPQPPTPPVTPAQPPYVPAPSEVLPKSLQGVVTATILNVRSGPAADYPIVRQLAQGATVTVTARAGRATSVWLQMGKGEWVYEKYIALQDGPVVPPDDGPTPVEPPTGDNWSRSRAFVKGWEGGFQDADWDAGNWTGCEQGKGIKKGTNFGISACAYPDLDIRAITIEQADAIYLRDYWQRSGADKLPWPMCLLVFDSAVNFHPDTAKKWLAESGGNMLHFVALRLRGYRKSKSWPQAHDAWVDRVIDVALEASKP